jgi:hypothetical protein
MKHLRYIIIFLLLSLSSLFGSTMYTLSGVKKVYPVVEIMTKLVPQSYKETITDEIVNIFDTLNIDHSGYDERAFAILVSSVKIQDSHLVNIQLLVGEPVQRLNSSQKVFADTYSDKAHFILTPEDELEDLFEDSLALLLDKFSEQYKEENKTFEKVKIDENNFAKALGYETSYEKAVQKAHHLQKDIMLVLVANYCPWCRKFEQRVLLKKEVNEQVQKNYIPLILNKEKDSFPQEYNQAFSPIVYFLDHKSLKSYKTIAGYNNREDFLYHIKKGE